MKVLVTGVGGFAGRHLARRLVQSGHRVAGLEVPGFVDRARELRTIPVQTHEADVRDAAALVAVLERLRPEGVLHLAGLAHVGKSFGHRTATFETNAVGTLNLLEALRLLEPRPRVVIISSADAYGLVPEAEQPIREDRPLRPRSPYGVSKAVAETTGLGAWLGDGLPVVIARSFNHIGAGQSPSFAVSDFARQVARIEAGHAEPVLSVGNLAARRDFTDVRDTVRAYELLLLRGRLGEAYNVATGHAVSLDQVVEQLQKLARVPLEIQPEADRMRPVDVPLLMGSPDKIHDELGWRASVPLEETLAWTLDYWRERVARGEGEAD